MIYRTSDEKMRKIVAELADKLNSVETTALATSKLVRHLADKVGYLADKEINAVIEKTSNAINREPKNEKAATKKEKGNTNPR